MKKFVEPEIQVAEFIAEDVVTTSVFIPGENEGGGF